MFPCVLVVHDKTDDDDDDYYYYDDDCSGVEVVKL